MKSLYINDCTQIQILIILDLEKVVYVSKVHVSEPLMSFHNCCFCTMLKIKPTNQEMSTFEKIQFFPVSTDM